MPVIFTPDFCNAIPSHANALELFQGQWTSEFPPASGLKTGGTATRHFDDPRITWAAAVLGGLAGKSILELGPYEGYNTYQFEIAGAASVLSIEASRQNFLRCLVVKNALNLRSTFLLGDFMRLLERTRNRYDICWMSGVLYHLTNPVHALLAAARTAERLFLWTHYHNAEAIAADPAQLAFFDPSRNVTRMIGDRAVVLHHRNYHQVDRTHFSGGAENFSYWISKEDIFHILKVAGLPSIQIGMHDPNYSPGPAFSLIAARD